MTRRNEIRLACLDDFVRPIRTGIARPHSALEDITVMGTGTNTAREPTKLIGLGAIERCVHGREANLHVAPLDCPEAFMSDRRPPGTAVRKILRSAVGHS